MSTVLEFKVGPGKPVLRGIAHYWSVILELDAQGSWSVHDIDQASNVRDRSTVRDYVRRLVAAGIATPTGERQAQRHGGARADRVFYTLKRRPKNAPRLTRDGSPVAGSANQQIWNVLRGPEGRAGLTIDDIALRASTDAVAVKRETVKAYIKRLAEVGYVAQARRGVWRLLPKANTGPKPPRILRTKIVYDQNRGEALAPVLAEEDRP